MTIADATFSPDRRYRYTWVQRWADGPLMNVLALNPSTADEVRADPTVSRCINRARALGYPGLCVTNIFALRSTDPRGLLSVDDPVGPDNDAAIRQAAQEAALVVCAWGSWGTRFGRSAQIRQLLRSIPLYCLGTTRAGEPRHPLYLRSDKALERWKETQQ